MGKGSNQVSAMPSDFTWSYTDEPHKTRRSEILSKYPQIKELYGHDIRSAYISLVLIASQVGAVYLLHTYEVSFFYTFLVAYAFGGTVNHALSLATHELSHNLFFADARTNQLFGIFCNVAMGLPSSISFKRYHMEHHTMQGHDGVDMDIPSHFEGTFFTNTFKKVLWVLAQPLFYAFRPLVLRPKKATVWEIINWIVVLSSNYCFYRCFGLWSIFYLISSTFLGMGLHPVAGHFISEHYVFLKGQETYSYYGPLNWVTFNVGYHNEHHDFPRVPGAKLPQVRAIAPEYYSSIKSHDSWCRVIYDYITDPSVGPYSRVKRTKANIGKAQ